MAATRSNEPLYLSRLHWPVTVLGYGRRIGVWFQGCSIRCKGCCSRDTWDARLDTATSVGAVLDWIARKPADEIDGFTITGGEPFDQPEALRALLVGLRKLSGYQGKKDILVYSGHPWRKLHTGYPEIFHLVDAVISEPYVKTLPRGYLRGSVNQGLHCLSDIGKARYGEPATSGANNQLQLFYDGKTLWMIGIPEKGDLQKLTDSLAGKGITLSAVSWLG